MGSIVDLVHPLNGQDRLSHPRGVLQLLARGLARCTLQRSLAADKRQGWGATRFVAGSSRGLVRLNRKNPHVGPAGVFLPLPLVETCHTHLSANPPAPGKSTFFFFKAPPPRKGSLSWCHRF